MQGHADLAGSARVLLQGVLLAPDGPRWAISDKTDPDTFLMRRGGLLSGCATVRELGGLLLFSTARSGIFLLFAKRANGK